MGSGSMRIGILAPIAWRTPPRRYGPWEQVCANLAAGLVARGHEVILFATGDSHIPGARLSSVCPRPLGEDPSLPPRQYETLHMAHGLAEARRVDILHNHFNCFPLCFTPLIDTPVVTTLHGSALLEPDTRVIYRRFAHLPYVSISDAEREGCPELNYVATVYNGIELDQFTFQERPGDYLVFLGRASAKKGLHLAVEVALRAGVPLVIAAHIPPDEEEFFEKKVRPRIDGRRVRYVGEVGPAERNRLLGGALALLHLVTVPEPFGLVLAEAQACGTPVIGFGLGSVPEVVRHGDTGFVVADVEEAVQAVRQVRDIHRRRCREWVEERFTVDAMVDGYIRVYRRILAAQETPRALEKTGM